jgi:hypothetical protein
MKKELEIREKCHALQSRIKQLYKMYNDYETNKEPDKVSEIARWINQDIIELSLLEWVLDKE